MMMSTEPRVPDAPRRVWRDWALLAVAMPAAIVEAIFNPEVVQPVASLLMALAVLPLLLWRRTHPLTVVVIAFGLMSLQNLYTVVTGTGSIGLNVMAVMLLLPYSLWRWGSGREALIGLAFLLVTWATSLIADWNGVGEAVGGLIVLFVAVELGALVRYQANNRRQAIERARLLTREQLARELHDSVAHHVSAIAIQAQGGRAMAAKDPDRATEVLAVIEEEAARALAEMRNMVGALREGDQTAGVELAPQPGLADIERLTEIGGNGSGVDPGAAGRGAGGPGPRIDLELAGNLDGLQPAVDTALYRLAQESITNAVRHARNASRVLVRVVGDGERVELTVTDDGMHNPPPSATTGYGLVGMAERAKLLGGTLSAGPDGERGWKVRAVLPRSGEVGLTAVDGAGVA